MGHSDRVRA